MDKESVRKAINHFKFAARPTSAMQSHPATVGDIEKLISEIAKLTSAIIDSIDD